ncbi:hypothetical protein AGMMS4957_07580 [Bacteroidia bacterium]|nr:hypothetical protein AGMMS4957_07580 [Bacteroidia bacterium]
MISLDNIKDVLNPSYLLNKTFMEEKREGMKIDIIYSGGYILFQSDKKSAKYLDFFHPSLVGGGIRRTADYIIITTKNNTIHCIIVELKKANDNPKEQLSLTEFFVDFMFKRICYKYKQHSNVVIRKVGAFKDKIPNGYKGLTKPGKLYDSANFAYIKGNKFDLGRYL